MMLFLWNLLLALIWATATREFSLANTMLGFALGYLILRFAQPVMGSSPYYSKVRQAGSLLFFMLTELTRANLTVAYEVLVQTRRRKSGIIAVPLDARSDIEIMLLSSLITLMPGTLGMDVARDRSCLYVHALFKGSSEALKQSIKQNLERRILELLR